MSYFAYVILIISIFTLVSLDFGFFGWFNYSFPIALWSCLYVIFSCHFDFVIFRYHLFFIPFCYVIVVLFIGSY